MRSDLHLREAPNGELTIQTRLGKQVAHIAPQPLPSGAIAWYWRKAGVNTWTLCPVLSRIQALDFVLSSLTTLENSPPCLCP